MRIRKSFEQAICILLLIGTSEYKQKLKEINLGEITNYVHQNSI